MSEKGEGQEEGALKENWIRKEGVHKKWQVRTEQPNPADCSVFKQLGRETHSSL